MSEWLFVGYREFDYVRKADGVSVHAATFYFTSDSALPGLTGSRVKEVFVSASVLSRIKRDLNDYLNTKCTLVFDERGYFQGFFGNPV